MRESALKHALRNAVMHDGKASAGAVMNKLVGDFPEAKKDMKALGKLVSEVIKEVNAMSIEEQEERLLELWPEALEKKEEKPKELPGLPGNTSKVVLRFAPNPNGPPTLGSARGAVINWDYRNRYKGSFILRFDDTDPKTKPPMKEAYAWYLKDMEWLGIKPDKIIYLSDHIETYYEYAEKLISMGQAYACTCSQGEGSEYRRRGEPCPHRDRPVEENFEEWSNMLAGKYKEGEITIRIKTDLNHPNPAIRDWVAFKIVDDAKHPLLKKKYKVWPLLDFAGAIEDRLLGTTHIIRGKDLRMSTERQEYIYKYFNWKYPHTLYWGRVAIHEFGKLSTSGIKKGIEEGKYKGWDDPRLPTLMALRKKGMSPEAITQFYLDMGLTERDVSASLGVLEAVNRKIKAGK